jgi:hypothetical protein
LAELEGKHSKFSSGLNIITRLDLLWRNCQEFKRNGQYSKWNDELDTIWLELARDLNNSEYNDSKNDKTGEDIEGYQTKFKKFDEELRKHLPFADSNIGFKKLEQGFITKRNQQYKTLMEKQLFLARLENELDKGTTYEDEDDDF